MTLRSTIVQCYRWGAAFGIDPRKMARAVRGLPAFVRDSIAFRRQRRAACVRDHWIGLYPCVADRYEEGGTAKGHYFHQDLLVARWVYQDAPAVHVDVGSRVDGFIAHVASYRSIVVVDIRPIRSHVHNVSFRQADIMGDLPADLVECCDSLSCLHALEHFGLGRYGDRVCYDGHVVGLRNLTRMLTRRGRLYLSVPVGRRPGVHFNAHRVFGVTGILSMLEGSYDLVSLAIVDDAGELHEDVGLANPETVQSSFGCQYGCAIFSLVKK
jgi:hypothetical protein